MEIKQSKKYYFFHLLIILHPRLLL